MRGERRPRARTKAASREMQEMSRVIAAAQKCRRRRRRRWPPARAFGEAISEIAWPGNGMSAETVRKVWLLWWTGWDSAPPLVKECAASWIEQNPTWTMQLLDRRTVYRHISVTCHNAVGVDEAQGQPAASGPRAAGADGAARRRVRRRHRILPAAARRVGAPDAAAVDGLRRLARVGRLQKPAARGVELDGGRQAEPPGRARGSSTRSSTGARGSGARRARRRGAAAGCAFHYFWMDGAAAPQPATSRHRGRV